MKRALITGITGQDGAYLSQFLLNKGYEVFGLFRRTSNPNFWRMQELGVLDKVTLIPGDMTDESSLMRAITLSNPDEIYNLAAQSYVGASFDQPIATQEIDGMGCLRLMEIIRNYNKKIKVYQASTSELYGTVTESPQSEKTTFRPNSPYAAAKLYAYHTARIYRESYGLFVSNGILFNHESPLRGLEFVTRKITNAVARIKLGLQKELKLGNIEAKRDWGYAKEYVEGMWRVLQMEKPGDYVIATGETNSVKEFAEEAFNAVGLNWQDYVKIDPALQRPNDVNLLAGDNTKLFNEIGWKPKIKFRELAKIMVEADLDRWKKHQGGEIFAWDAPNYPEYTNIIANEPDHKLEEKTKEIETVKEKIIEIKRCRICKNEDLIPIISLGNQNLSGRFPNKNESDPIKTPLDLVKCNDSRNENACGLLQLKHTSDLNEMYGETYGYRSGLNKSMVDHLTNIAKISEQLVDLDSEDVILDIGSNDATMLKAYTKPGIARIGIDPTAEKFRTHYTDNIKLISDFFSADKYRSIHPDKKAKIITSIAMFYDLEDPTSFAKEIKEILHKEGIWVLEQSYMPKMLEVNAFDTICQEHLEYYSLKQIEWMLSRIGLKVFDLEFNNVNGGSFKIYVCHQENPRNINETKINEIRNYEKMIGLDTMRPYQEFKRRVESIKDELGSFIKEEKANGKKIHVCGASTKGNVLLQYLDLDNKIIDAASDVNQDKWGKRTPGTNIPITSEEESRSSNPDYYLVLPWHFKSGIIEREKAFLERGGKLIFPMPQPEIIGINSRSTIIKNDTLGKTLFLG